jgi:hypothetical protein
MIATWNQVGLMGIKFIYSVNPVLVPFFALKVLREGMQVLEIIFRSRHRGSQPGGDIHALGTGPRGFEVGPDRHKDQPAQ